MDDKNKDSNYKPDITNYDYVWGSDQDEYIKSDKQSEEEALTQEVDQEQQ